MRGAPRHASPSPASSPEAESSPVAPPFLPPPPPFLPPPGCLSTPPSATSCSHPTPPGSVCLPGTSASTPSHPRAACNSSCGEYWGPGLGLGEGHPALPKAPAPPLTDLPFKLEVISCVNCRAHHLTCRDPTLCPGQWPVAVWLQHPHPHPHPIPLFPVVSSPIACTSVRPCACSPLSP